MELLDKIKNKETVLGVIGLGYIGLPVACFFASNGFKVKGIDLNQELVQKIENKECPIENEAGFADNVFYPALDNLEASSDPNVLNECDAYIVCVQTPVKDGKPNTSYLEKAVETVSSFLDKEKLVVIESTVPPGTSKKLFENIQKDKKNEIYFAHCPERVIPGNLCREFVEGDRLIGGVNQKSGEIAKELYSSVIKGSIEIVDCTTAELVKVIENTYRNTNIALANEIAKIADKLGVNAYKAIELANRHPRVNIHQPGCGVGGHCIPVAPILLTNGEMKTPSVIQTGLEINQGMCSYFINLLEDNLNSKNIDLKNAKVIIMGYAYKGNSAEIKDTPSKPIYQELKNRGVDVSRFDPYIKGVEINNWDEFYNQIKNADALLLVTKHDEFSKIDLQKVKNEMRNPFILDGRGFYNPDKVREAGVDYDGIGI